MKNEYQIGGKVRLVSERNPDWSSTGEMDHFLGSEQIIKGISDYYYPVPVVYFEAEITHDYCWNINDIDCKISDEVEFQQGETVLVWDDESNNKIERIFISKIGYIAAELPFIVMTSAGSISAWKNCEKVPTPPPLELTIEEIAEKFGVKPEQIKIK